MKVSDCCQEPIVEDTEYENVALCSDCFEWSNVEEIEE